MGQTLDKFLSLSEDENKFHLLAVGHYTQFLADIRKDVPLDKLTDEDPKQFLSDWDYGQYEYGVKRLQEWLGKCLLDNPEFTLSVYPDSFPTWGTWGLKGLLVKVYQRKQQRQMVLAAQKEREERAWQAKIDQGSRYKQAQLERSQFLNEINNTIKEFKKQLAKEKKPKFAYPQELADYHPDAWCKLQLPTKQEVENWAGQYIRERVPSPLRNLVCSEVSWQLKILPYAEYEALGVPCLTWCFRVLILVKVHLWLVEKEFNKDFHGYSYQLRVAAQELGAFYLGPVEWGHQVGFVTPLALLAMLAKKKLEDDGIEVMGHVGSEIAFCVRGYEEEVTGIDEAFRQFIVDVTKDKTLAQGLLAGGMIDEITAQLVEEKAELPLPQPTGAQASAGESASDKSDVTAALQGLGYKLTEINEMMKAVELSPDMSLEEKIKAVLKGTDS